MVTLHIYAQPHFHCEAYIAGDRAALTALRDTLDAAIRGSDGSYKSPVVFVNDGEGYEVIVVALATVPDDMMLPYTDDAMFGTERAGRHPWDIVKGMKATGGA